VKGLLPYVIGAALCAGLVTLAIGVRDLVQREPVTLTCSVDDTVVFVAFGVTLWHAAGDLVTAHSEDGRLVRRMEINETCREYVP